MKQHKAKAMKDLKPGDTFVDSLGYELTVITIEDLDFVAIPGTSQKVLVRFKTQNGNEMFQNFRANRMVAVK